MDFRFVKNVFSKQVSNKNLSKKTSILNKFIYF